jgi:ABC-type sugar transport system permease subunit
LKLFVLSVYIYLRGVFLATRHFSLSQQLERVRRAGPDHRSLYWWYNRRRLTDLMTAFLFLSPSLLLFGVFVYYALGFNIYLSFTSWNFLSETKTFIGFANFERMFSDQRFWRVVFNTFYYAVGSVTLSLIFGLALALLLNCQLPWRGFFRTLIFSPYVTTIAAISLLWIWIFDPRYGLINYVLGLIGIEGPRWLTSTTWAMPALIIMNVWHTVGYCMVIYLAGLSAIPRDLHEAAAIDGAGRWAIFRYVTLPLLSPTTFFLVVTSLIGALQVFDSVAVMTRGGPVDATKVFNYYIYEQAFAFFRAGYAAAVALVLFIMILALTAIQIHLSRRWVHYQ